MLDTEQRNDSLNQQLRRVMKDGIDYLGSVLTLAQARATEIILSGVFVGILLLSGAAIAAASAILLVIAAGIWLSHLVGSAALALTIVGGVLAIVAALLVWRALVWINNLKS